MKIAVTGATGFIGRYIVRQLIDQGHKLKCWCRPTSDIGGLAEFGDSIDWVPGQLGETQSSGELVKDCDAVIHAAFWRPGRGFRDAEGDVVEFARVNILGSLQLIEASRSVNVRRFIFISTCAVHEKILSDRLLDEAHPLWPLTHYGAHKAAIEKFVHSYGLGQGFPICALRPTGVYGCAEPVERSKWFDLVSKIVDGQDVEVDRGGKEVHASDVAKACQVLLSANQVNGQSYACYDRYISDFEVATIAKELSGSSSRILGNPKQPKNQIDTSKIRRLGMEFGSTKLLRTTLQQLVDHLT